MRRSIVAVVMLGVMTGCGSTPAASDIPTRGTAPDAAPSTTGVVVGDPAETGTEFEVDDVEVPEVVTDGVESTGGVVLDEAAWDARFPAGTKVELPSVDAELIEAASEFRDGERVEERTWMLIDDRDRYELVEDLRDVVGADNVVSGDNASDETSKCTVTVARVSGDESVTWVFRACDYPAVDGMHAVGIMRSAPAGSAEIVVDPTISSVLAVADGAVTSTGARLQIPNPGEEALVRDARVEFAGTVDPVEVGSVLRSGGLDDWALQTGEGSVILTGPRGETWMLTDRVAQFDAGGSW